MATMVMVIFIHFLYHSVVDLRGSEGMYLLEVKSDKVDSSK